MKNFKIFWRQFATLGGYENFLTGLKNTAFIAVFGLVLGLVIGCIVATVKIIPKNNALMKFLKGFGNVYVTIFRGTPMVVQLLLLHFALFPLLGINIGDVSEAAVIFGLNSGAYMTETLRAGINSVDKGQMEAGRSLGLSFGATMMKIILPQAVKNILPNIGNEFISLIKETSVVSFIAVTDITKSFRVIAESTYEFFVPYIMLAIVYLVLVIGITALIRLLERRFAKNER